MRVVAGTYGGRTLTAPKGDHARPTSDRVKESLFAILRADVPDAAVLDLYAGSGALGLEALSRGARHVTFVDRNPRSIAAIRANLRALDVPAEAATVVKSPVMAWLNGPSPTEPTYGLVLLDPPYDTPDASAALQTLADHAALSDQVTVVAEHARNANIADVYGRLERTRTQRYGDTSLSFFSGAPSDVS
ncbi:16S rRNA (guanine(966)-N(2))-methyltransferase RsmD [Candidatus Poribacteria bacterium]|nr:16S rRNA (guanine(966)-N(2))-methyltransferase RsmD [Candidatus Poribacteria bacterium]